MLGKVDGQPVEHIRVDYILRGLRIPAGQHTVEFKFEPKSFERGKLASALEGHEEQWLALSTRYEDEQAA